MEKLDKGNFYRDSYFTENITIEEDDGLRSATDNIEKWDNYNQHQLCTKALKWLTFRSNEIDEFCFKAK